MWPAPTSRSRGRPHSPEVRRGRRHVTRRAVQATAERWLTAWQDGKSDSALGFAPGRRSLEPRNPKPCGPWPRCTRAAPTTTPRSPLPPRRPNRGRMTRSSAPDRREALSNGWHLVVRKVQGHPAAQRAAACARASNSMQRGLTSDRPCWRGLWPRPNRGNLGTLSSHRRSETVRPRFHGAAKRWRVNGSPGRGGAATRRGLERAHRRLRPGDRARKTTSRSIRVRSMRRRRSRRCTRRAATPPKPLGVFDSLAAHAKDLDPDALFGPGARMEDRGSTGPGPARSCSTRQETRSAATHLFSLAVAILPAARLHGPAADRAATICARPANGRP